jgi:hypothetical protein
VLPKQLIKITPGITSGKEENTVFFDDERKEGKN